MVSNNDVVMELHDYIIYDETKQEKKVLRPNYNWRCHLNTEDVRIKKHETGY